MKIKKIQDADLEEKKVILRVDFNVSIENGHVKESFKIEAAKESLAYLMKKKSCIALVSYFGRPEGKFDPKLSMGQLKEDVQRILGVNIRFIDDCIGPKVAEGMESLAEDEILMLENVRFYPGEDENDDELAKKIAEPFDVFINDAFSQSHRDQASITGITKFLPSFAGFRLQKEILEMERIKKDFSRPAVAIIGGAKIETKLPVINFFEKIYDHILVGGKIANEAIDEKIIFSDKIILPVDYVDDRMDIGPKTRERFIELIKNAKTVVWNGPLGKFEEEKYSHGSGEIMKAILEAKSSSPENFPYVLIGGGETLELVEKMEAFGKIDFISTGGGAMLDFLGGAEMPGIETLKLTK